MNIENLNKQEKPEPAQAPIPVENEIRQDIQREAVSAEGPMITEKQILQILAVAQPIAHIQQTAQNQISKGYLNIKV